MNDINPGLALHNVPAQHTVPCSVLESIKLQRSSNNTAINTPRARYSSMGNPHHTMEDLRHGGPGSRKRRNSRPLAVGERFRLRQSAPTQPSSRPKKYIQNNSPTTKVLSPKHPGDLFSNPVNHHPKYSMLYIEKYFSIKTIRVRRVPVNFYVDEHSKFSPNQDKRYLLHKRVWPKIK